MCVAGLRKDTLSSTHQRLAFCVGGRRAVTFNGYSHGQLVVQSLRATLDPTSPAEQEVRVVVLMAVCGVLVLAGLACIVRWGDLEGGPGCAPTSSTSTTSCPWASPDDERSARRAVAEAKAASSVAVRGQPGRRSRVVAHARWIAVDHRIWRPIVVWGVL